MQSELAALQNMIQKLEVKVGNCSTKKNNQNQDKKENLSIETNKRVTSNERFVLSEATIDWNRQDEKSEIESICTFEKPTKIRLK